MNEFLLTMTACIDPRKGDCTLVRSDPAIRLADYESSLQYWLGYADPRIRRILFIENSGTLSDSLKRSLIAKTPGVKR